METWNWKEKKKRTEENNETIITILRERNRYIHKTGIEHYEKGIDKENEENLLESKTLKGIKNFNRVESRIEKNSYKKINQNVE